MAQIGIKLADHTFYPVLGDETPQRKRMVLSPAQERQTSIQVDIVRRSEDGDQSVGCLVLEDVQAGATSEFELVVGIDEAGNLDAEIRDPKGEQFRSFSINVSRLDVDDSFLIPEIGGDGGDVGSVTSIGDELDDDFDSGLAFDESTADEDNGVRSDTRPFSPLLLTAILLIALSLLALGAFGVFSWFKADFVPGLRTTRLVVDLLFCGLG